MKTARILVWGLPLALLVSALAHEAGPPPGYDGGQGRPNCAQAGCHDAYSPNSGSGEVRIVASPARYEIGNEGVCPPETTSIKLRAFHAGQHRWGFQLSAMGSAGQALGHLHLSDTILTQLVSDSAGRPFAMHTTSGTFGGWLDSSGEWTVRWRQDSLDHAPLWLFVSAVAADGDGLTAGDYVYTDSLEVEAVNWECFLGLPGDLNDNGIVTPADVIFLVNYLYKSGPEPSYGPMQADIDCSGGSTAADIIKLVNYTFKSGRPPCDPCSSCCPQLDGSWICP